MFGTSARQSGDFQVGNRRWSGELSGAAEAVPGLCAQAQSAEIQALGPIQLWADGSADSETVKRNAAAGFQGSGSQLPFIEQIQNSFGHHSLASVQAHLGGSASAAAQAMEARAYTAGENIAFRGAPDLRTVAHEAAHVVQQRSGVQLSNGVGQTGDQYEKNADKVADAVVAGRSAERLLSGKSEGPTPAPTQVTASPGVQRKQEKGPDDPAPLGAEVWVKRSALGFDYHHAGVYIGNDEIIHVTAEPLQAIKDLLSGNPIVKVVRTNFKTFAGSDSTKVGPSPNKFDAETASIRAQSLTGLPWSYDPLNKNCQHFSSEMVCGSAVSPEADKIKAAFEAVVAAPGKAAKAAGKGLKKVGGWIAKAAKKVGGKIASWFS